MGAAWCRERAEQAHDSKSPIDRVFVNCVDKVYPRPKSPHAEVIPFDGENRVRTYHVTPSTPAAVHRGLPVPSGGQGADRRQKSFVVASSSWQAVELQVPRTTDSSEQSVVVDGSAVSEDGASIGPTPVPPPRKKRHLRRPRYAASAQQPSQHRSISTIVPPTIVTDDRAVKEREQKLSTVSLPDYQQLNKVDHNLLRPSSSASRGSSLTSVSEATVEKLDSYIRRNRSFGSVNTGQLVEQLVARSRSHTPSASSSSSSEDESDDSWGLGGVDQPVAPGEGPPLTPTHRLSGKRRKVGVAAPKTAPPPIPVTTKTTTTDSPSAFFHEDDPVNRDTHKESELREVKKELQSIIYDFNLYAGKDSTSRTELEMLPNKPLTQERRKKISIKSITPPPSPELTDHEDEKPRNGEDTSKAEIVSKIINGYHKAQQQQAESADDLDAEAAAVLRALGMAVAEGGGHSRRSSMTPSLNELEAAISDLLEQTASADDDDSGSDVKINLYNKTNEDKIPEGDASKERASTTTKDSSEDVTQTDKSNDSSGPDVSKDTDVTILPENTANVTSESKSSVVVSNGVTKVQKFNLPDITVSAESQQLA